jgi:hypothetical protein
MATANFSLVSDTREISDMNATAKFIAIALLLTAATQTVPAQVMSAFGETPLWFESVSDQEYVARGPCSEFTVRPAGAEITLKKSDGKTAGCTMQFVGANPAPQVTGSRPLAGKISRLLGSQRGQWQTGLPTFGQVMMENIYPGVNVLFYGNQKMLEYDFQLAAGADSSAIALKFAGADGLAVNEQGSLVVKLAGGEIVQHPPLAYQTTDGVRHEISAQYKILDRQTATFVLGAYDRSQPLVIDPVLSYSTFYGGNLGDTAWAIAVNPNDGSVYVAGQTFSTRFTNGAPFSSAGAFQTNFMGGKQAGDAFVARFDNTGTNLIYATYLGGSDDDAAYALAVDADGNAYVTGATASGNFPTANAMAGGATIHGKKDPHLHNYLADIFVSKLDPSGSNLLYSSYVGGSSADTAYGIALDQDAGAYITGFTYSTNFPVTPGAFQTRLACKYTFQNANAFVTAIRPDGTGISYSTYLGGTNYDVGRSIAFNNGRLFVAGHTVSTNFPGTNMLAGGSHLNGGIRKGRSHLSPDAFVAAFDASSTNLPVLYSTYLGGTNIDIATGIAADASGNAYVAGYTTSTNFPVTATNVAGLTPAFVYTNNFSKNPAQATNGFLTQITWDGSQPAIGGSAMFGGKGVNIAEGVALDPAGNIYLVGSATSTNFPATTNISWPLSATNSSKLNRKKSLSDVVIMAFSPGCTGLLYSAYLGGQNNDYGQAIAVDPSGAAYIAGRTLSTNFPVVNAFQPGKNATNDMFIAKISPDDVLTLTVAPGATVSSALARPAGRTPSGPQNIKLKWKMFPPEYDVQTCDDINRQKWRTVPQTPCFTNGWYQLDLPATLPVQFFRLHRR